MTSVINLLYYEHWTDKRNNIVPANNISFSIRADLILPSIWVKYFMLSVPFTFRILRVLTVLLLLLFSSRCLILRSTQCKLPSLFRGLTPSFQVIFHVIFFSTTKGDITKNNWLQKFGKFFGKLLWGSFFQ